MKLTVLGGGTAGWLTALFLKKMLPSADITVIQNKKIGIIGVGEATTPPFIEFLSTLDINTLEFLRDVGGTIKNGISFENWNGNREKYFHGFRETKNLDPFKLEPFFNTDCLHYYIKTVINKKLDLNEYIYSASLSYSNKVDVENIIPAVHFDTNAASNYFENIGKKRNISIIEDKFLSVKINEHGFLTKILLENTEIETDFVFDCSGFARLIFGQHFKERWISYKKHLPMKSAIPFHLKNEDDIKPYTSAIALKHGWIWKIPLLNRVGSGYVFDSDYITPEEALVEAQEEIGQQLNLSRVIQFEAGRFERYWIKNSICIGLSSSFIEPLESTNIHMTVVQLKTLKHFFNDIFCHEEKSVSLYNKLITDCNDEILHFVYLHYLTNRRDSEFWKNFRENYPPPEKFQHMLEIIKDSRIRYHDTYNITQDNAFDLYSYLYVCKGLDLFEKDFNLSGYENISPSVEEYKKIIDHHKNISLTHKDFLERLKTI